MKHKHDEISDESLMRLLDLGDEKALELLYNRYAPRIYGYLKKRLDTSHENAQDAVHDVFLKIVRSSSKFDTSRSFKTWIYSIANNHCKNIYDAKQVRKRYKENIRFAETTEEQITNNIDKRSLEKDVMRSIEKLDHSAQSLIYLRFNEELSIKEIAEILNIPAGTVKSRIFHVLRKLAKSLHQYNKNLS